MSLNSFKFLAFFFLFYFILMIYRYFKKSKDNKVIKLFFLLTSYFFIMMADYRYLLCVLSFTFVTYIISVGIIKSNRNKKRYLLLGLSFSVLQLMFFKYFDFFSKPICEMLSLKYGIWENIVIPIGISFYSFSAISYLVDIYQKKCEKVNYIDYSVYISFFPKFICGPLVRPQKFFDELNNAKIIYTNFETGIQVFMLGIFKKMVLADHLAVFVDDVFDYAKAFSSLTVWLATFAYSLQIYFDFSGYSDIAIGLSKMLGFNFEMNFNLPYISKNLTEFWKRWHISLSSWLQDYLYIPLGGNRKGKLRTYLNLFVTMLIGGFWHGANWTFIVWGAINGIGLIVHKLYASYKKKRFYGISNSKIYKVVCTIFTFSFVNFCWIFFRSNSLPSACVIIHKMFCFEEGITQIYTWIFVGFAFLLLEMLISCLKKNNNGIITYYYPHLKFYKLLDLTVFFTFVGMTAILAYVGETQFIYGKF